MEEWNRRRFISTAAVAAGSGFAGWKVSGSHGLFAQAPAGIPDEILNPVEVSGAEAQPVMGKLPGQKRMYVLPDNAGEYHRVGSQVMKRIARREDTGDVHELARPWAGRTARPCRCIRGTISRRRRGTFTASG